MPSDTRSVISTVVRTATQALYALIAFILLLCYALVRGYSHLVYRSKRVSLSEERLPEDLKQWKKIPKHLAVCFVPSHSFQGNQRQRIEELIQDAASCVRWAVECKLERISLFDPDGMIQKNTVDFKAGLVLTLSASISDSSIRPTFTLSLAKKDIDIHLLSPKDGKPFIAKTTTALTEAVQKGLIQLKDVDVPLLREKLEAAVPAPQLMIVLGGRQLKLHGFPPWQLRLTEIYHEPSLGLLGPSRLTYSTFKRAMDLYSGCEMRFGR